MFQDVLVPPRDALQSLGAAPALVAPSCLLVLFLAQPSRILNLTLLPLFLASALYTSLAYTTGSPPDDYGRASLNFSLCLIALDRFVVASPNFEVVFHKSAAEPTPPAWSWRRLGWALKMMMSMRGAGWSWQVSGVPTGGADLSRGRFVRSRLLRTAMLYIVMDAVSTYMQSLPYFHRQVSLASLSFVERQINMLSACAAGALAIAMLHSALSALCVASGAWSPGECPDLFGPLSAASSLRGFWSKTWSVFDPHQSFRRPFTTIPRAVLSLLRLSPASPFTTFLSISFAFFLSALQHAFAVYAMDRRGRGAMLFFCIQPLGILAETLVSRASKGAGGRSLRNAVGYAWTACWLLNTCTVFFDELAGMWEVDPAPFSVVKGLTTGQWLSK
ncbi:hypothetical protein JCM5296_002279 [Sporobolomyces johnsonii]